MTRKLIFKQYLTLSTSLSNSFTSSTLSTHGCKRKRWVRDGKDKHGGHVTNSQLSWRNMYKLEHEGKEVSTHPIAPGLAGVTRLSEEGTKKGTP